MHPTVWMLPRTTGGCGPQLSSHKSGTIGPEALASIASLATSGGVGGVASQVQAAARLLGWKSPALFVEEG